MYKIIKINVRVPWAPWGVIQWWIGLFSDGPKLWIILYNEVLETPLREEVMMIYIIDDQAWLYQQIIKKDEFSLVSEKTEALIMQAKKKISDVTCRKGNAHIIT